MLHTHTLCHLCGEESLHISRLPRLKLQGGYSNQPATSIRSGWGPFTHTELAVGKPTGIFGRSTLKRTKGEERTAKRLVKSHKKRYRCYDVRAYGGLGNEKRSSSRNSGTPSQQGGR